MDWYNYQVHQKYFTVQYISNAGGRYGIFYRSEHTAILNRQFTLNRLSSPPHWILVSEQRMRHYQIRNKG
jgi:hypothetical protein